MLGKLMTRLSLRFLLPLLAVLALVAYGALHIVDRLTLNWFRRDLDTRSHLIVAATEVSLANLLDKKSRKPIEALFTRMTRDERLYAIGFCDPGQKLEYKTLNFPENVECRSVVKFSEDRGRILTFPNGPIHLSVLPIESGTRILGHLILLHDMSFVANRSSDTKRFVFYLFLLIGFVVSLVTVVVAQLSWKGWVSGIRSILRGEGIFKPESKSASPELRPILKDLQALIRDLETEHRAKDDTRTTWTAKTLKEILFNELRGDEILVVSNREPYIHDWKEGKIEARTPASGLVTALEPIMRACSGTWIAHGSGTADKEVVDKHDRVRVPPDKPAYQIRRVWLTAEEENGYYYGFANEGLWPLCHIAHVRPVFRSSDWDSYVAANEKFAAAVVEEAKTEDPVILVQDYHFALLPSMVREKLPRATIITFWHIPWPNPEAFGICPWRHEILAGLLGSSILGFHTRFHCNNFLDTADRFLECRIDRERSTLSYREKLTAVRQYPISIEWPPKWLAGLPSVEECRARVRARHRFPEDMRIGIGVDRLDYTKGILERLAAVERLFEISPDWIGKVAFVQIAAPSRSKIERYQIFQEEVRALAKKINERFGEGDYQPIVLLTEHHESEDVYEYFRASDFCLVTSLHDGMNLVAKEFIASRDDERGVLILSMFTGAARELPEAFIVNPYSVDQCAEAIRAALEMSPEEQRERMRAMRGITQEFNVFRWAGRMLVDAGRMRQRNRLHERMQDWEFQEKNVLGL